jgi:hypothetical protein
MGVLKSNAALVGIILLLGPLVPYRPAQSRDAETVVPIGALAHAADVFQEDTGGKVLEIRLADTAGARGSLSLPHRSDGRRNVGPPGHEYNRTAPQLCEHMAKSRMTGIGTPNIHNRIPRPIKHSWHRVPSARSA